MRGNENVTVTVFASSFKAGAMKREFGCPTWSSPLLGGVVRDHSYMLTVGLKNYGIVFNEY